MANKATIGRVFPQQHLTACGKVLATKPTMVDLIDACRGSWVPGLAPVITDTPLGTYYAMSLSAVRRGDATYIQSVDQYNHALWTCLPTAAYERLQYTEGPAK